MFRIPSRFKQKETCLHKICCLARFLPSPLLNLEPSLCDRLLECPQVAMLKHHPAHWLPCPRHAPTRCCAATAAAAATAAGHGGASRRSAVP